ncbi:unnamed protein product [Natator depressus]
MTFASFSGELLGMLQKQTPLRWGKNTFHNPSSSLAGAAMSNWPGWFFLGVVLEPKVPVHSFSISTKTMQEMPAWWGRGGEGACSQTAYDRHSPRGIQAFSGGGLGHGRDAKLSRPHPPHGTEHSDRPIQIKDISSGHQAAGHSEAL